jgi:hypothetical protein
MAKTENPASTSNINHNTNNVNLNVKLEQPRKRIYNKKNKSNWIKKAIVGGLITVAISLAIYYFTSEGKTGQQGVVENGSPAIQPSK